MQRATTGQIAGELAGSTSVSLEGQFKALEGNSAVDDELAKMKGLVRGASRPAREKEREGRGGWQK